MDMIRCVTNDALTFQAPFVTSKYNGITSRSGKERCRYILIFLKNVELKDNALIWRLIAIKHKKLLNVECKRQLFCERKN